MKLFFDVQVKPVLFAILCQRLLPAKMKMDPGHFASHVRWTVGPSLVGRRSLMTGTPIRLWRPEQDFLLTQQSGSLSDQKVVASLTWFVI